MVTREFRTPRSKKAQKILIKQLKRDGLKRAES